MPQAFLVEAESLDAADHRVAKYAALVETPEDALAAVRGLVSDEVDLRVTGDTLPSSTATAIGLRLGQARLV